jgi:small subunit ribosomal protein S15
MARMHSRDKGKSGSNRPALKEKISWVRYKPKEIELLIVKLAKEGIKASRIGLVLRDSYGIPSVKDLVGKSITKIMREKKLLGDIPEDLLDLIKRSVQLKKHLEENHKDNTAKRGLRLTESKINRLIKYYKGTEVLSSEWKYDEKRFKLMAE